MNLTDLFPDAPEISFEAIREGDIIARMASGNVLVSEAVNQTSFHGPAKWLSENQDTFAAIKGRMHLLVRRPAKPLPTETGDMVRIINPGTFSSLKPGEVLTRNGYGDYVSRWNGVGKDVFKEFGITWEQVWFTNMGPDVDVVDAEVLPAEDEPAPAPVALPVGPVLIHIASGRYKGAIGRRNYTDRFGTFNLITEEGEHFQIEESEVQESTWEAVVLRRNDSFYATPSF